MIGISSIEHGIAIALNDVVIGEKAVLKALAVVALNEGTIEKITGLIPGYGTPGVAIERVAFAVLAMVITAVKDAQAATEAKGLNVSFDEETITAVEAIIKALPQIAAAGASTLVVAPK